MLIVAGVNRVRLCHFYNYNPISEACTLNHVPPSEDTQKIQEDLKDWMKDWETWIPVEPSFNNRNYQNKLESFSQRLWSKIVFQIQET